MRSKAFSHASLLLAGLAASAAFAAPLSVTGKVTDKLGAPLPDVRVCRWSDMGDCVNSAGDGTFQYPKPVPNRAREADPSGYALAARGNALSLTSPVPARARLAWTDAAGRLAAAPRLLLLQPGANPLDLPFAHEGRAAGGIHFLKVEVQGLTLTWKAVLQPGAGLSLSTPDAGPRLLRSASVLALSKASAVVIRDLVFSKDGYRLRVYVPAKDTVKDVAVALAARNDSGPVFTAESRMRVLQIDRAAREFVMEIVDRKCDAEKGVFVPDTLRDTSAYALRPGSLYTWDQRNCQALVFHGPSSDLVGAWQLSEQESLPADVGPAACRERTHSGLRDHHFRSRVEITETQAVQKDEIEMCTGDLFMALVRFHMGGDSASTVVKNTCKAGTLKDKAGNPVDLTYGKKGDSLTVEVAYKGATCKGSRHFGEPKDCPDNFMGPFMACLATLGFQGPGRQ